MDQNLYYGIIKIALNHFLQIKNTIIDLKEIKKNKLFSIIIKHFFQNLLYQDQNHSLKKKPQKGISCRLYWLRSKSLLEKKSQKGISCSW